MKDNEDVKNLIEKVDSLDPEGHYIFEINIGDLPADVLRTYLKGIKKSLQDDLGLKHFVLLCINDTVNFSVVNVKESDFNEVISELENKKVGNN